MSSTNPPDTTTISQVSDGVDHVQENRLYWDDMADDWIHSGETHWARETPIWGSWDMPESELQMLPESMLGIAAIELGCGTGYISGWMARRGANVTAIDNSQRQLKTAERLMRLHKVNIEFVHGNAEIVPVPDASFDFAISEYGASIWCNPFIWIAEAHRILKPRGLLTFLGTHPLAILCMPDSGDKCENFLHKSYFELGAVDWRKVPVNPGGIEFNLTLSSWLKLFRESGFEVLDYLEIQASPEQQHDKFDVPVEWARRWPSEQVWKLRKV